jgi:hypothetical protein
MVLPGVCGTGTGNSTLNHMMHLSVLRRSHLSGPGDLLRSLPLIVLAVCAALSLSLSASAKRAKNFAPAMLVEEANYLPCGDGCSALASSASAFCLRQGDQVLVGEGRSYLHEGKFSSLEELAGKQFQVRFNGSHIWMRSPGGDTVKIERGSRFENFKDAGCIRAVRAPILKAAYAHKRPGKVPAYAFAVASMRKGDLYLWFQCDLDPHASVIACRKWYENGDFIGKDWYCPKTQDGAPVPADFEIDRFLSQAGKLVLKSGAVVPEDHRARTNDVLDRPNEVCR